MAQNSTLSLDALTMLTLKATPLLLKARMSMPEGAGLSESFEIWRIDNDQLLAGQEFSDGLAQKTNRWHHQIRTPQGTIGFLCSSGENPDSLNVDSIYRSPIAKRIDQAISLIDATPEFEDFWVRLVEDPLRHTRMLWVGRNPEESKFIVVEGPLQRPEPYPERDLLDGLRATRTAAGLRS